MTKQEMIEYIYEKVNPNESDCDLDERFPVNIGDILEYIGHKCQGELIYLLHKWKNKREPIESQSEDCILYIYNLIK